MGLIPSVDSLTAGTYINVPTIGAGIASASPIDLSGYFGNSNTSSNIFSNMGLFDAVFGGIASILNTGSTNRTNAQIARETNEQNYKIWQEQQLHNYKMFDKENQAAIDMFNLQNQAAIDMWNMQNAYNDPTQQVARLEQAGINPYLYLSGQSGAAGNASSAPNVGSLSPGDINPSQAPTMVGYQHQAVDLTPFMQGLQMDMQKKHFEITSQIEMMKTMAEVGLLGEQQRGSLLANNFMEAVFDYQVEQQRQASLQSIAKTAQENLLTKKLSFEVEHMDEVYEMDMLQRTADYMFTLAQEGKTKQECANLLQDYLFNEDVKAMRKEALRLANEQSKAITNKTVQETNNLVIEANNLATEGQILQANLDEITAIANARKESGYYKAMADSLTAEYEAAEAFNVERKRYETWKNQSIGEQLKDGNWFYFLARQGIETVAPILSGNVGYNIKDNSATPVLKRFLK